MATKHKTCYNHAYTNIFIKKGNKMSSFSETSEKVNAFLYERENPKKNTGTRKIYKVIHRNRYYENSKGYATVSMIGLIAVTAIIFIIAMCLIAQETPKTKSTIKRTKTEPKKAFSSDCIDDKTGWIKNKNAAVNGMRTFYKQTGIQPLLYITESTDKNHSESEIREYAQKAYAKLSDKNEKCVLLFFTKSENKYRTCCVTGKEAETVMDSEAVNILLEYADRLYADRSLDNSQYFGQVFAKTAAEIMQITPTFQNQIPIIINTMITAIIAYGIICIMKKCIHKSRI